MQNQRYKPALISSLILHAVVLAVLIINLEFSHPMMVVKNQDNNSKVISAMAVEAPPAPVAPMPQVAPPPKVVPKPVIKPQTAVQPPPAAKPQAIVIPKKEEVKPKPKPKDLTKDFLADIEKETKQEKAKKEKSLEKAMEQEMKEQAAKALQQDLLAEQQRAAGAKALGIVNKYKALIVQAISRKWLVPAGADKKRYSELMIHLAPGGMVLDVQISKSSGDVALDRSARDAVFKASPLPVPSDANEFESFRQFVLKVRPENVVMNDA